MEAAPSLRRALEIDPERAESHHACGVALLHAGFFPAAETSLRQAVRLIPSWPMRTSIAAFCWTSRDETRTRCRLMVRRYRSRPSLSATHRRVGDLLQANGQIEQAIAAYLRGAVAARDTPSCCCAKPSRWTSAAVRPQVTWPRFSFVQAQFAEGLKYQVL
jgi:tetratricopeptide (TPR) repeat protein